MAIIKIDYPSSSTVAITCSAASLASDTNLLAGQSAAAVDNTTNLDLDHLVSGKLRLGTSPTASKVVELWAYAPISIASGTATYPDVLLGTDAAKTLTSDNVKQSMLRLVWSTLSDATTGRDYFIPPTSIANLFGYLPNMWSLFVVHNTGVALDSTAGNFSLNYHRIQQQTV